MTKNPTGGMRALGAGNSRRSAFAHAVVDRSRDVILLALMLTWLFDVRFTYQIFSFTDSVLASSTFSLAAVIVAFGMALWLVRARRTFSSEAGRSVLAGVLCALSALVGVCALLFVPESFAGLVAYSAGMGACVGACMAMALALVAWCFRGFDVRSLLIVAAAALSLSLALSFAASIIPFGFGALIVLCPLGMAVGFYRGALLRGPTQSCVVRTPKADSAPRIPVMLFISSFLAVYLPTMFPKTTQLAPAYFTTQLGGASYASLVAFVLCCLLFVALAALVKRREIDAAHLVIALVVLLAAVFFSLPFMNSSSTPFSLMMPCAALFVFLGYVLALLRFRSLEQEVRQRFLNTCVNAIGSGALLAATFAFVFLGPLYGGSFQDGLFVAIPGLLIIVFFVLLITRWKSVVSLLGLGGRFLDDLDTSILENRCIAVGKSHGLTRRELEVLALLAEGRNEPYIEQALSVSRATVKTHISHIYHKIGVSSRQELIDLLHE